MDKRGQFFLIAALVIVALLLSVGTMYNSARVQREDTKIGDVAKELNFEGARVIDSGVYSALNQSQIASYINSLAQNYSSVTTDSNLTIVYGDKDSITTFQYNCISNGNIGIITSSLPVACTSNLTTSPDYVISEETKTISVEISEKNYTFELQPGQNFYIIVKRTNYGETFVSTN